MLLTVVVIVGDQEQEKTTFRFRLAGGCSLLDRGAEGAPGPPAAAIPGSEYADETRV